MSYKDTKLAPGDRVRLSYSSAGERIKVSAKVLCSNSVTIFIDYDERVYRWKKGVLSRIDQKVNDVLESSEVHWLNPCTDRYLYVSPSSATYLLLLRTHP